MSTDLEPSLEQGRSTATPPSAEAESAQQAHPLATHPVQLPDAPTADARTELRRKQMLALVRARDFVRVAEMSAHFHVSEVTIRSDLEVLSERGQLRRVRGGAMSRLLPPPERSFTEGLARQATEKEAIARAAAALVASGDTIILDVGTTTTALAHALLNRADLHNVVIMTNSLNIALDLEPAIPRFTVVVLGGTLRPMAHSLVDPLGEATIERIHAHTVFLACNGVDAAHGITNTNLAEITTKRALVRAARQRVVLADGTKIGVVALAHICAIPDVDLLLTDKTANQQALATLRDRHLEVRVAE